MRRTLMIFGAAAILAAGAMTAQAMTFCDSTKWTADAPIAGNAQALLAATFDVPTVKPVLTIEKQAFILDPSAFEQAYVYDGVDYVAIHLWPTDPAAPKTGDKGSTSKAMQMATAKGTSDQNNPLRWTGGAVFNVMASTDSLIGADYLAQAKDFGQGGFTGAIAA